MEVTGDEERAMMDRSAVLKFSRICKPLRLCRDNIFTDMYKVKLVLFYIYRLKELMSK